MPITVLGKTFETEEERRAHFRQELRQHLPALKEMEGFPIGEDDDIIALSDPPFYTACPNPWLNDFIKEWEEEKTDLEKQEIRNVAFEVEKPYTNDISEGKNNPIYNAHSYHTKVPHFAVMRYILHYTEPGDIIFDGFAGTGMTGIAAQVCGDIDSSSKFKIEKEFKDNGLDSPRWGKRQAICGDLSPIASFISYNYNTPTNVINLQIEANRIIAEVEKECGWMYETTHADGQSKGRINYMVWSDVFTCPECREEMVFWEVAVDTENGKMRKEFHCPSCEAIHTKNSLEKTWITKYDKSLGKSIQQIKIAPVLVNYKIGTKNFEKKPDNHDLDLVKKIENLDIPFWHPTNRMPEGDESRRNDKLGITNVHQFNSKRNLIVLAAFWSKSQQNTHLKWAITGIMQRSSIQHQIAISRVGGEKANAGGKTAGHRRGTLYIPSNQVEFSPFTLFKSRIRVILRAILNNKSDVINQVISATSVPLNAESIDYIFADPPFGANIMYSELNFIWDSWLKVRTNNKQEAIKNRTQNKGLFDYNNLMTECFKEYYRILKKGKWMTVEFSNTSAAVWNSIQQSIQQSGFVISTLSALDKKQKTHSARTSPTAVKQDLVISCYKPSSDFDSKFKQHQHLEIGIWDFVEEHLNHLPVHIEKNDSTTAIVERSPKILFDRLIAFYIQNGLPVPIDATTFQQGLRQHFIERDGMFFTEPQLAEYDQKKAEIPNFIQLSIFVTNEQESILWLREILEKTPQKAQDLRPRWMKEVVSNIRKGDLLPELKTILEENFLSNEFGDWRIPDPENEADLEALRHKRLLKQFNQYIEIAQQSKGKLKEARIEALRAGFKQCYKDKEFNKIMIMAKCLENSKRENIIMEDEVLLQFYDIASTKI